MQCSKFENILRVYVIVNMRIAIDIAATGLDRGARSVPLMRTHLFIRTRRG